jgi:maltoporin
VHDKISSTDHHLSKFSSALEFAFDKGVWERPVLRLYHTYAKWSDGASVASDYYLNSTDGNNIGVQIEYWW